MSLQYSLVVFAIIISFAAVAVVAEGDVHIYRGETVDASHGGLWRRGRTLDMAGLPKFGTPRPPPVDELPRFPMGVNSTFDSYISLCPSRKYRHCFGNALKKRYRVHEIFKTNMDAATPAAVSARDVVGCDKEQNPSLRSLLASPSAGVGFVRAALIPPPPPPPNAPDPLASASELDADSAAVAVGTPGWRPDPAALLGRLPDLQPSITAAEETGDRPIRCSSDSRLLNERTFALLGVPSMYGPVGKKRRDAARTSWMQAPEVGRNVTVCFLLSAFHPPEETDELVAEATQYGDMLFLRVAESRMILRKPTKYSNYTKLGRSMPTFKQFAFFDHAATALPGVPFVGKVDDDTAVNLREMLPLLESVSCLRYSFIAAINWGSLIPKATFAGTRGERCAFGWAAEAALNNFGTSYGTPHTPGWVRACDEYGAVPPFPYGTGAGYIFSGALLQWLAKDQGVRSWVAEARGADKDEYQWQKYEDTTTGYWMSYANESVHYVNIGRWVHDFRCRDDGTRLAAGGSLYRPASPSSLLVHNLKHGGFHAAMEQMQLGAVYDHERCVRDGSGRPTRRNLG